MIFSTTRAAIRNEIRRSDLRLNLLRICAREPRTIHDLIRAPSYPGIPTNLFTIQSELGVTVELGECKNRELLVRVGQVPDPIVPEGRTELLRTSLLAFLLSPELASAEPAAYALYLNAWFRSPSVAAELGEQGPFLQDLFLAFPELASRLFFVTKEGPERRAELPLDLGEEEWVRVFGLYHLADLPTQPKDPPIREWLAALRKPPLPPGGDRLRRHPLGNLSCGKRWALHAARLRRGGTPQAGGGDYSLAPLAGPELLGDRLRPSPVLKGLGMRETPPEPILLEPSVRSKEAGMGRNPKKTTKASSSCPPALGGMVRRWAFWIVGGTLTGLGLVGLGAFLLYHRLGLGLGKAAWIERLSPFWGAPLGFGAVVLVHALDVARDRRTLLRLLDRGEGSPRLPVPGARDREEPSRERE